MKLIKISNNVAVNPESIDAIEVGKGQSKKTTIIQVGTKTYTTEMGVKELLTSIELASTSKWDGFFGG